MQPKTLPSWEFAKVNAWHQLSEETRVREAVANYIDRLRIISQSYSDWGRYPEDGDYPIEVFSYQPPFPSQPPLILMGGMGPLAGAMGFDLACEYFGDRREILLYQACSIPNRMTVMAEPHRKIQGIPLHRHLVEGLSDAIARAREYLSGNSSHCLVILLCNAVHYFLPQIQANLQKRYPTVAESLQYITLMEAVAATLERNQLHKPLLLATSATLRGKIYVNPLKQRGIEYQQLSERPQEMLMDAIYRGVKAFDRDYAYRKVEELFRLLLAIPSDSSRNKNEFDSPNLLAIDSLIAGCTEVPILLDWLQAQTQCSAIQHFLDRIKVINPVLSAFEEIASR
ncbi:MAG: aspartate/glutamate racemase family protein [Spirulina sp.]